LAETHNVYLTSSSDRHYSELPGPRSTTQASGTKRSTVAPARSSQPSEESITQPSLEAATARACWRERSAFLTNSTSQVSPASANLERIKLASLPLFDTGLSRYQVIVAARAWASVSQIWSSAGSVSDTWR